MRNRLLITALLLNPLPLIADVVMSPEPAIPPPMLTEEEASAINPEVTIIRKKEQLIEEYRINGQIYMIKITPNKGYPYYLVDSNGDGNLDARRNDLDPELMIPKWIIFSW